MIHKPDGLTKTQWTLELLKKDWLTALESAQKGGCMSLSQRVGQFKRRGYDIRSVWLETKSGSRVLMYRCVGKIKGVI